MKKGILMFISVVLVILITSVGFAKSKPIVLGAPLSTAFSPGWVSEKGMNLAIEEINAAGGVKVGGEKRPFKLEVMDTRDMEPGVPVSDALLTVEKLILSKKADFLIGGPIRSEAALPTLDLVARYKKVHIMSAGSISPGIGIKMGKNIDRYKYSFRISGDARWHVRIAVGTLMRIKAMHGLKRIFFIVQDAAYARAGTGKLRDILKEKGWEITGFEVYPMGSTDFSAGLLKAKRAGPGVLLAWMELPEGTILAKQWYDMKVPSLLFGSPLEVSASPRFWKATKGRGEYIMSIMANVGNAPSEATPWTMKFNKAYEKKYGILPEGSFADTGYMAVNLLKDAVERAGTINSNAVVKALEKTDLIGVYGRMRFNPENHDLIFSEDPAKGALIGHTQWQAGKMVVVNPLSIANGKIKLPPWMK